MKTTQRLNLLLTINKHGLDIKLIDDFKPDVLLQFCGKLEERKTPQSWYSECINVQKELLNDERFFFYLPKLNAIDSPIKTTDTFINVIRSHEDSPMNYPIGQLISSMVVSGGANEVFYDYLKNFSGLSTGKEQKKTIITNLGLYRDSFSTPIEELPESEKTLFFESSISERNMVPVEAGDALCLLAQKPGLTEIIRFFCKNKFSVDLDMESYEVFSQSPDVVLDSLKKLLKLLGNKNMGWLMERWQENNFSVYDLDILNKKLMNLDDERLEDAIHSRSGYLNLIYDGRIKNISLSDVPKHKEDILIYAIINKKNGFIRLIEENYNSFISLSSRSILFNRDFYTKFFNINSLNVKNLVDCGRMESEKMSFNALENDRVYTFKEIQALYKLPEQYLKLYTALQIPRIDDRLIAFKQLSKQKLLSLVTDDELIGRLADAFTKKPLSKWREQEFAHIAGLKPQDAVDLIIRLYEVEKLIPQIITRIDASLVIRNWNTVQNYNSIDEMKSDIIKVDRAWAELVQTMGFTDDFLRNNHEHIIGFLCMDGAEITRKYYNNLSTEKQKESMKFILKAELMGKLGSLKYYADDLLKEINYPLTYTQKTLWIENTEMSGDDAYVRECDDFFSTMRLGTIPQRTCLSYINGMHNKCLLSCFDSNKKVIYAYINGVAVGRAIVRLTKGKFSNLVPEEETNTLSFVDLEAQNAPEIVEEEESEKEKLVLFLERSYSAGITDETSKAIQRMYVDLMIKKAKQMGAMLVVSNLYDTVVCKDFTRTLFHIYISRSKAGAQYLDSLNGSAMVSDEGGYRANNFYIQC